MPDSVPDGLMFINVLNEISHFMYLVINNIFILYTKNIEKYVLRDSSVVFSIIITTLL